MVIGEVLMIGERQMERVVSEADTRRQLGAELAFHQGMGLGLGRGLGIGT